MTKKPHDDSVILVTRPSCGESAVFSPANPYRPFCSKRCKAVDLGAWANEEYRIPGSTPDLSSDDPDSQP